MKKISDYEQIAGQMITHGFDFPNKVFIKVENSKQELINAMTYFLGQKFKWLPEYNDVAEWLGDNQGRGLFLFGANGRGKTILAKMVIPAIILNRYRLIVKAFDSQLMNSELEKILKLRAVSLDDVGTEDVRVDYGERRWAFPEIMDASEKRGNLVIITSNLDAKAIELKYGLRTIDRIKATCKRVVFDGRSMRG